MHLTPLLALASQRQPFRARIAPGQHPSPGIVQPGTAILVALWPMPNVDRRTGEPVQAPGWAFLALVDGRWSTPVLEPSLLVFVEEVEPGIALLPVDLTNPVGFSDPCELAEAVALAIRTETRCRFVYRKAAGEGTEAREVTPTGTRGLLVFAADHGRGDALRSFKMDGITQFRAAEPERAPRWDSAIRSYSKLEREVVGG